MSEFRSRVATVFAGLVLMVLLSGGCTASRGGGQAQSPAWTGTVTMEVTAYCPCKKCCGRNARGVTASGQKVTSYGGRFVSADTRVLPFYTWVIVPGYNGGKPVPVLDRGSSRIGNRMDVFFPTHAQALQWGRQVLAVRIVEQK